MIEIDIRKRHLNTFRVEFDKIKGFYIHEYKDVENGFVRVLFSSYKGEETEQAIYDLGFKVSQIVHNIK